MEHSVDPEPLYFWPESAWHKYSEAIREAKSRIKTNRRLVPRLAFPGCGKVLALEERPDFVCEYGLVMTTDPDRIQIALECYLGLRNDPRWVTLEKSLSAMLGTTVREV